MKYPEVLIIIAAATLAAIFIPFKYTQFLASVGGLSFLIAVCLDWLRQKSEPKPKRIDNSSRVGQ